MRSQLSSVRAAIQAFSECRVEDACARRLKPRSKERAELPKNDLVTPLRVASATRLSAGSVLM